VLATEDRRFFDHFGIDIFGLFRALTVNAQAGGVVQAARRSRSSWPKTCSSPTSARSNARSRRRSGDLAGKPTSRRRKSSASTSTGPIWAAALWCSGGGAILFRQEHHRRQPGGGSNARRLFKAPTKYAPSVNLPAPGRAPTMCSAILVQSGFMTEGQVIAARRNPASVVDRAQVESPDFFSTGPSTKYSAYRPGSRSARWSSTDGRHEPAEGGGRIRSIRACLEYGEHYNAKQGARSLSRTAAAVRAMVGAGLWRKPVQSGHQALRQPGSSFKIYTYSVAWRAA